MPPRWQCAMAETTWPSKRCAKFIPKRPPAIFKAPHKFTCPTSSKRRQMCCCEWKTPSKLTMLGWSKLDMIHISCQSDWTWRVSNNASLYTNFKASEVSVILFLATNTKAWPPLPNCSMISSDPIVSPSAGSPTSASSSLGKPLNKRCALRQKRLSHGSLLLDSFSSNRRSRSWTSRAIWTFEVSKKAKRAMLVETDSLSIAAFRTDKTTSSKPLCNKLRATSSAPTCAICCRASSSPTSAAMIGLR
mmetsp:Transcript_25827/g.73447  ORF Transcript_25827/g.73447 Transcript_25827/m.73447 type:complete len:247 (+) Transcript_25827:872-1612(+)